MKAGRLSFGRGNHKVDKDVLTFSLPAGHACPNASHCLGKVDRDSGKFITRATDDLTDMQAFVCYAAKMETHRPSVRKSRWHNFELLRALERADIASVIDRSLPKKATRVRVHVSGDFFKRDYFLAWMDVARSRPDCTFYAYTKMINLWIENRKAVPANFRLIASYGGRQDAMIDAQWMRFSRVVKDKGEALELGLAVSAPDSDLMAERGRESFALVVH